jgi:hypothetical protein
VHYIDGETLLKIFIIYRGPFGEQMTNNLALRGFGDEIVTVYELKPETIEEEHSLEKDIWSKLWEDPERFIPRDLPIIKCDLLIVLGIHSRLGDLIPSIAKKLDAKAVLYPIDDRDMAPEAKKTVQDELESAGIYVEFPKPFCILDHSDNRYINEFSQKFGRPKYKIKLDDNKKVIKELKVIRDTPSGTAHTVGNKLINFPINNREELIKKIFEEHHNEDAENYCMAEMDPICPLMQEAGDLLKDAIFEACGFEHTKNIILRKVNELKEVDVEDLKKIIVNDPGDWKNPEKACETERTFYLYLDELIDKGKIVKRENKLKPL